MLLVILTALANALASVLQRLGLEQQMGDSGEHATMSGIATSPTWVGGVVLMAAGFGLQAIALHVGSIVVVQPLLLIELPVIVAIMVVWFGQPIALPDALATGVAALSLGGTLALVAPDDGPNHPSMLRWLIVGACALGAIGGTSIAASFVGGGRRAALLGLAAATGFGLVAALTKDVGDVVASHPAGIFASWQLWALAFVGCASFVAMQRAFESGSFVASQSALILGTPLLSILVGAALYGVTVTHSWWRQLGGVLAVWASSLPLDGCSAPHCSSTATMPVPFA